MQDVNYLVNHGERRDYLYHIDSSTVISTMTPNQYSVEFVSPMKNVVDIFVLDYDIPGSRYLIDGTNDALWVMDRGLSWKLYHLDHGDYETCDTFVEMLNIKLGGTKSATLSKDGTLTFSADTGFTMDFNGTSLARITGFARAVNANSDLRSVERANFESRMYTSKNGELVAPCPMDIRHETSLMVTSPEIEQHLVETRSFRNQPVGLGRVDVGRKGHNDYNSIKRSEFFPIGKLSRFSLMFLKSDGYRAYDFHGVHHTLTLVIRYILGHSTHQAHSDFQTKLVPPSYLANHTFDGTSDDDDL